MTNTATMNFRLPDHQRAALGRLGQPGDSASDVVRLCLRHGIEAGLLERATGIPARVCAFALQSAEHVASVADANGDDDTACQCMLFAQRCEVAVYKMIDAEERGEEIARQAFNAVPRAVVEHMQQLVAALE